MLIVAHVLARLRDRSGFTLIETLVAMVTGVVVTFALLTILEVATRQTSHLSGSVSATAAGRDAMDRLTESLHSACIESGFAPVKKESSPTKLILVSGYDQKPSEETPGGNKTSTKEPPAELTENDIYKDEVEYNAAAETLTDKRYTANGTTLTNGEYAWKLNSTNVLSKVAKAEKNGESVPIFQYYAYNPSSSKATTAAASTLNETSLVKNSETLSAAQAEEVAAVEVAFRVGNQERTEYKRAANVEKGIYAEFSTLTTFAFMAPNSEASIKQGPCE